jgi:hypothetical protein
MPKRMLTGRKPKRQLVARGGYYSSLANCRTIIPAIFCGIFKIFRSISKFFFCLFHDLSRNPVCETLLYAIAVLQSSTKQWA